PHALRWILMFDAVSCIIPGASRDYHVQSNIQASDLEPLSNDQMVQIQEIYEKYIKKTVHHIW
ncbi:MAG: aldo/keto reductase, partial [Candidatus Lokiarchaeota archaeon]|nr:aldo/keto reductase [Candidatus Lokiarchaeota archaeon]